MRKLPQVVLLLSVLLSGCTSTNEFENLEVSSDYESIVLIQSPSKPNRTIMKLIVKLRNSSKEPIYVDGKFVFSIVTIANQLEKPEVSKPEVSFISKISAAEMSLLQYANSWTSVNEVFQAIQPYDEVEFVVAIDVPTNTYIKQLDLVDRSESSVENIGSMALHLCPNGNESISTEYWYQGKKCQKGKIVDN